MAQNGRKQALRIRARTGKLIRVTDAAGFDFHQHFAGFRPVQIHRDDFQRLAGGDGNSGFGFHFRISCRSCWSITSATLDQPAPSWKPYMNIEFTPNEARVIGCLIEKEITTPDQYPLSLNALTNACNQKTNREPVLELSESEVQQAVDSLMKKYMVSDKSAGYGGRVTKYKHRFCNTEFGSLKFSKQELGIICVHVAARPADAGRAALAHQSLVRIRRCRRGRGHLKRPDDARGWAFHRAPAARAGRPRIALCALVLRRDRIGRRTRGR